MLGTDPLTKVSYDHRKEWFYQRLTYLVGVFTIEVGGYSIMNNHYHLNIKTRPDLTEKLTDAEVAKRWYLLYPPKIKESITPPKEQVLAHEIDLLKYPGKITEYRERLGSLSWFMKSLNEYIARKGNLENDCTGRFWDGRYKSKLMSTKAIGDIHHIKFVKFRISSFLSILA